MSNSKTQKDTKQVAKAPVEEKQKENTAPKAALKKNESRTVNGFIRKDF